ncbi:MAG: hypothetical protein QW292_14620, partial [Candidatus Parvarchaeota archaeon]
MTDIAFLGVFSLGAEYRINLSDSSKSFTVSIQDVEMYVKTGLLPSGLKEKISNLPGKLQRQI